ncbi:hypothetical protein [Streptomyces sp. NEAU-W12]|uniref:hypothetical protein n=1 Tax=Streptomyces sp. NEAU-W12 TaxID=2994668 RepID=UPI00224A569E|nr:hypothetical protein [Streptomyces sp. NEAU-W12]MCX2925996.1 hypothetical protein [Streptomyces sp. NEAU-W12]
MSAGTPLASWKARIFESVRGFLPDRVQITVPALVVLVVASWAGRTERRSAHRCATRAGRPVHAAPYGQGGGADHLGRYAPQPGRPGRGARPPRRSPRGTAVTGCPGPAHPGSRYRCAPAPVGLPPLTARPTDGPATGHAIRTWEDRTWRAGAAHPVAP